MQFSIVVSITAILVSIYMSYKTRKVSSSKERLEKLYAPLFVQFENLFFKYNVDNFQSGFDSAFEILKNNIMFASDNTRIYFYKFSRTTDEAEREKLFTQICYDIIYHYNLFASRANLAILSEKFRVENSLYKNLEKMKLILKFERIFFRFVVPILILVFSILVIIDFYKAIS